MMWGEGTMRINSATNEMITAVRRIAKKYSLTQDAVEVILERTAHANSTSRVRGTLSNQAAIYQKPKEVPHVDNKGPEREDAEGGRQDPGTVDGQQRTTAHVEN